MTSDEFSEIIALVCPHCRKGLAARQRTDTKEWVHDIACENARTHSICWATGFRNSRFMEQISG